MQNNLLILFLGVICVIEYGNGSTVDSGVETEVVLTRYRSIMSRTNAEVDACTEIGVKCSADCTSLILCLAASGTGTTIACSTNNPTTPVCDKNKNQCTASLSTAGCEPPNDSYTCMMDGVFPDPSDCRKYFMCADGVVTVVSCTSGTTYNAAAGACVTSNNCPSPLVCGTTNPSFVVYRPYTAYFMLCIGVNSYMMKCENDVNQFFDTNTNKCVYACKAAGSFPDANTAYFWYCPWNGANGVKNACPDTYVFDTTSSKCIPSA